MTDRVSFTSRAGRSVDAALAVPAGTDPAPAIIILHEYWGLNDHTRDLAARFAAEGYLAMAPDLYQGVIAKDSSEAMALLHRFDWAEGVGDVTGAVAFLREHPRSNGEIAVTGFCMGGALAFAVAQHVPGLAAVVPFYGIPPQVDASTITAPVCAHFSATDPWAKPELAQKVREDLQAAGKLMDLHVYDAPHAFFNDGRPEVFAPEAAAQAWQRTLDFLAEHTAKRG